MNLIELANIMEWEYGLDYLKIPDHSQFDLILEVASEQLAESAFKSNTPFHLINGRTRFKISPKQYELIQKHKSSNRGIKIMNSNLIEIKSLTVATIQLDSIILKLFMEEFLPNPDKTIKLVRLSDYQQVAISAGMMQHIKRKGITPEDVVKRTVWDYSYWPDIEENDINYKLLSPNENSSIITKTRFHDTTGQNWRRSVSKNRLVQDSFGTIYRLSESIDVEEIDCPVK
jgi:hypothetical protein